MLRSTILIAFFTILAKIAGLVRIMVFGNQFGDSAVVDIFVAALRLPDLLFNLLILGTLSVAFIPVFVEYKNKNRAEAYEIASTIFNIVLIGMGVMGVMGAIFAPALTSIIVPGFDENARAETARLTRILMLSPLIFSLSSVLTSVLQSNKRFLLSAIAPLFYTLSIIGSVFWLYPVLGVAGIGWGAVIGALLHFLIQLPQAVKLGLRPFSTFSWQHAGVKKIGRLFLPRILALDLGQISFLIVSIVGSALATGTIARFYYAYDLQAVPLGIFAISFAVAAFPTMSEFFEKRDLAGFKRFFSRTAIQILFLMIPISVLMLILRAQIVRLIPGGGPGTAFDFTATRLTAAAFGFFTLSLFAQGLTPLLARCFFALQNTVIPLVISITAAALNILLAIFLTRYFGGEALALAFSVAAIFNMLALFLALRRRLGDLHDNFLLLHTIKILIASIVMAAAAYLTLYAVAPLVDMTTYLGVLLQALSAIAVAIAVYLIAGLAVRLPETSQLLAILKNWLTKFTTNLFTGLDT